MVVENGDGSWLIGQDSSDYLKGWYSVAVVLKRSLEHSRDAFQFDRVESVGIDSTRDWRSQ